MYLFNEPPENAARPPVSLRVGLPRGLLHEVFTKTENCLICGREISPADIVEEDWKFLIFWLDGFKINAAACVFHLLPENKRAAVNMNIVARAIAARVSEMPTAAKEKI